MSSPRSEQSPSAAENSAWFAYRATARKQGREVDERTFRDGWRQGCDFTFGATSVLSPAINAFVAWMDYVTSWKAPGGEGEYTDPGPAGARMTTEQMDGADSLGPAQTTKTR